MQQLFDDKQNWHQFHQLIGDIVKSSISCGLSSQKVIEGNRRASSAVCCLLASHIRTYIAVVWTSLKQTAEKVATAQESFNPFLSIVFSIANRCVAFYLLVAPILCLVHYLAFEIVFLCTQQRVKTQTRSSTSDRLAPRLKWKT